MLLLLLSPLVSTHCQPLSRVNTCPACLLLCPNSSLPQQNLKDAASWLGYTYLYVRMLGSPALYGVPLGSLDDDLELEQHRLDLAHSAAVLLDKHNLIRCVGYLRIITG